MIQASAAIPRPTSSASPTARRVNSPQVYVDPYAYAVNSPQVYVDPSGNYGYHDIVQTAKDMFRGK
jgi:hypothetical protein